MSTAQIDECRVLLLAATRRDAQVIESLLAREELSCTVCKNAIELASHVCEKAGVVLLTDEAFHDPAIQEFLAELQQQPAWSDLPSVLLSRAGRQSTITGEVMTALRNVTALDRPTPSRTLISSIKAALRARQRQYQMRAQFEDLRASEVALKQASDALQDANRRKDEFLAMLAHELRNPLAPLRNASEVLARKIVDADSLKVIKLMKRQIAQLSRLVDDLLDVSRITEGRIELRRAPIAVAAILQQGRESVEPLIREKQQMLFLQEAAEPFYVLGDHARLVQSLANVLTNASKYTDREGQISLSTRRVGAEVVIAVTDNGIGISPDLLPRLFDLFVQGERALDRSQGGLGIGLSVVKRLVEMHSGRITASSAGPHRGSTFEVSLPLIEPPTQLAEPQKTTKTSGKRILVVDDNQDAADTLAEFLSLDGHSIEVVYTARDAIARATASPPEVILLDVGLPDMSGYEVAAQLRPLLPATQIVALTGYGQSDDIRHASAVGFDAHVIKPVDFDRLAHILASYDPSLGGAN